MILVTAVAAASLAVALFIETSSWWIRGLCSDAQFGLYVSRSNIYLYGGRFFSLIFIALISFFIESGAPAESVAYLIAFSFIISALVQTLLLFGGPVSAQILRVIAGLLFLPRPNHRPKLRAIKDRRLFGLTTMASFFFGLGTGAPLLLAALIPEYRLSIANVGQIINAGGMLLILFFVDQSLFRALDAGTLLDDVIDYSYGRIAAFLLVGVCCLALAFSGGLSI